MCFSQAGVAGNNAHAAIVGSAVEKQCASSTCPALRGALRLMYYSAIIVISFVKQGTPRLHFALGPANYVANHRCKVGLFLENRGNVAKLTKHKCPLQGPVLNNMI